MLNHHFQLRRSLLALAALTPLFSVGSCNAAAHAISTGANYPEAMAALDAPAAGSARVVIYTDAKLADAVSVDRDVYQFRGKTFFTLDLPAGEHLLTCSGISITWGNPGLGKNRLTLDLAEGQTVFVAMRKGGAIGKVDQAPAEVELANLPVCKSAGVIDTISDEKWNPGN